jgi:hypothetical protein
MNACFGLRSTAKATQWPLSILVINLSLYRKGAGNLRMMVAILVQSSMIKMQHDALLKMRASRHWMAAFSISAIHRGNRIEIVGYDNIQFTNRRKMSYGAWVSSN